ncbi:phosphatidylethanolamine-binding protein [Xylaria bambusicola]|uniref:phosphatidylethanolamine-binding protein n=1 Tax=Xylaria bambusicola TaxID=326684 RepID=UPI0020072555|nr:phosphatidylethanolamine-binding protein [Xylaria bambusicola]KAI0525580.1 phosphatidylethanolamine-binding protein [Xylaria bambusicola]
MLSKSLLALAASMSGALAATPAGFEPGSETGLLVTFGDVEALDGAVVAKDITQTAPTLATQSKLDGTSFAVIMIDLDIPTDNPPETNTLLHWMQTGLTQSPSAETTGSTSAFVFSVPQDVAAFADYLGPAPPARIPLSHRYTEIIVDTSDVSQEALSTLETAAANRLGFNALDVLTSAGLADKVVAGNFFNVTNQDATATNGTASGGNGTNTGGSPSQSPIVGAAVSQRASTSLLAVVLAGVAFFAL